MAESDAHKGGGVGGSAPSGFRCCGALRSLAMDERHNEGRGGARGVIKAEKGEERKKMGGQDGATPFIVGRWGRQRRGA
jgi:hypothetical protein